MVKGHGKKQRAKNRSRRTGAAHASAAANAIHTHTPLPDMAILTGFPFLAGEDIDTDLAARLVAACRTGCEPCQRTMAAKVIANHRPTLAALAAVAYGVTPLPPGPGASPATRSWEPLAKAAKTDAGAGIEALATVMMMDDEAASDLLEDALDHWAAAGATPEQVADVLKAVGLDRSAPPRQRPADPTDAFREAGIKVFTLDDLDLGDDIDPYYLAPNYGVVLMQTTTPDGRPMPMLVLYPETEDAGIEDLEHRTDWEHWGLHGMPDMDPHWRLRANIADRSLSGLVHVGSDGEDDIELWRAAESVSLPAAAWDLFDTVQHVLVAGPVKNAEAPGALQAAGDAGELLAVVARVSFH
ncbi:hypothetical protein [Streptomyces europaeiscabiei]|uniref:hypothetical protein n=1 Tax=Streptomyces europaeiscabiei TaxID=146819 RepID=UPI0029AA1C1E|nr:hypothetical protein [Streptomyces europaeiscabiei]MDX3867236.1 hypothetical protein [Streptomyces europaeiscabiei]